MFVICCATILTFYDLLCDHFDFLRFVVLPFLLSYFLCEYLDVSVFVCVKCLGQGLVPGPILCLPPDVSQLKFLTTK